LPLGLNLAQPTFVGHGIRLGENLDRLCSNGHPFGIKRSQRLNRGQPVIPLLHGIISPTLETGIGLIAGKTQGDDQDRCQQTDLYTRR